jgi:lysophospholipase L1-like esterase
MPDAAPPFLHRQVVVSLGVIAVAALAVLGLFLTGFLPSRTGASPPPVGMVGTAESPQPTSPGGPAGTDPLRVVALGDSVPAATGCPCRGYIADVGTTLQALTHRPVTAVNDATGGWTTADVVNDLASGSTPTDIAGADLVIVQVGANDFDLSRIGDPACFPAASSSCWRPALTALRAGLEQIAARIHALDRNPALRIAFVGYWNVTVDGQVAASTLGSRGLANSNELTSVVNATISGASAATHSIYVDAYTPFKGENGSRDPTEDLLEDGDPPTAPGHETLTAAVQPALAAAGAVAARPAP